jgi:hypothetical protein
MVMVVRSEMAAQAIANGNSATRRMWKVAASTAKVSARTRLAVTLAGKD